MFQHVQAHENYQVFFSPMIFNFFYKEYSSWSKIDGSPGHMKKKKKWNVLMLNLGASHLSYFRFNHFKYSSSSRARAGGGEGGWNNCQIEAKTDEWTNGRRRHDTNTSTPPHLETTHKTHDRRTFLWWGISLRKSVNRCLNLDVIPRDENNKTLCLFR